MPLAFGQAANDRCALKGPWGGPRTILDARSGTLSGVRRELERQPLLRTRWGRGWQATASFFCSVLATTLSNYFGDLAGHGHWGYQSLDLDSGDITVHSLKDLTAISKVIPAVGRQFGAFGRDTCN